MIKILLLFLLPFSLYASKVLSYNIYERSDRADVMITFDTPFHGTIKQSKGKNKIIIKLEDASIESAKSKKVNSDFLHSLKIVPLKNQIHIVASISPDVKLIASKTSDAYGLRLRFTKKAATKNASSSYNSTTSLSALPTKKETTVSTSYIIVVTLLLIGIVLLFILKKKIQPTQAKQKKVSWLFNSIQEVENESTSTENIATQAVQNDTKNISIRFQKALNSTNSVVMLDFGEESYLVLMGNSNILLDKFRENKPSSQQEFDEILQDRNKELEDFLGSSKNSNYATSTEKEPLQAYKERAASLLYSDES